MSITVGIELCKKPKNPLDGDELASLERITDKWVSWKNIQVDIWMDEFLFEEHEEECHPVGVSYDEELWHAVIPIPVIEEMVCIMEMEVFLDEWDGYELQTAKGVARGLKKLLQEIDRNTEVFIYYAAGC